MLTSGTSVQRAQSATLANRLTRRRRKALSGYLFISPWLLGFLVFSLGPILASLGLSFTSYNLFSPPKFIGLDNYTFMFTQDALFWSSVNRTLYFSVVLVIVGIAGALACAMLLNQSLRGTAFFRTAFFIPSLTPIVAAAILWRWILQPAYGPLNALLSYAGIAGPGWLVSPDWAIPALLLIRLWNFVGGAQMVVFLAGLQGIPQEFYDAADVDGANGWQRFRNITLPMLSPTIFFNLIVGIVSALRVFTLAFIAADPPGGPNYATWFYILHLYDSAFNNLQMGYASALAWVFFLAVLALTALQFYGSRHWVYYGGD
jgi:multiple sugar transport system permease protein